MSFFSAKKKKKSMGGLSIVPFYESLPSSTEIHSPNCYQDFTWKSLIFKGQTTCAIKTRLEKKRKGKVSSIATYIHCAFCSKHKGIVYIMPPKTKKKKKKRRINH